MECKLCNKEAKLIKAHIIPEFVYRDLDLFFPDKKGQLKAHKLIFRENKLDYNPHGTGRGLYDSEILCKDCDGIIIKKFEDYGKKVFSSIYKQKSPIVLDTKEQLPTSLIKISDPKLFIGFIFSMFWRASISKTINLALGKEINDRIKKILFSGSSPLLDNLNLFLIKLDIPDIANSITEFKAITVEGSNVFAFITGNILNCLIEIETTTPSLFRPYFVNSSGNILIPELPRSESVKLHSKFSGIPINLYNLH